MSFNYWRHRTDKIRTTVSASLSLSLARIFKKSADVTISKITKKFYILTFWKKFHNLNLCCIAHRKNLANDRINVASPRFWTFFRESSICKICQLSASENHRHLWINEVRFFFIQEISFYLCSSSNGENFFSKGIPYFYVHRTSAF